MGSEKVTWSEKVVITPPVHMFQPSGVLYESYDNFMPSNFISGFKLEIQCLLAKMPWKYVSHYGWLTKKILVSWIVICTQKCFERRFALLALLIVFHSIILLLITFQFISLLIPFSKQLLKNDYFEKWCVEQTVSLPFKIGHQKHFSMLLYSYPWPKCTPYAVF